VGDDSGNWNRLYEQLFEKCTNQSWIGRFWQLYQLIPLEPLHQPYHLAAIEKVFERLPGVPQVACFHLWVFGSCSTRATT
jgi:hypothetical protein